MAHSESTIRGNEEPNGATDPRSFEVPSRRNSYRKPELTVHGDVVEITRQGNPFGYGWTPNITDPVSVS